MNYRISNNPLIQKQTLNNTSTIPRKNDSSFHKILEEIRSRDGIKFSKHAIERLEERNISLSSEEIQKLNNAVNIASEKGVKDALIIMNNKAFIASIKNNTIITAATDEQLKNNVFTNIDGAVII